MAKVVLLFGLCVHLLATPWTAAHPVSLSFTFPCGVLTLISTESVMSSIQVMSSILCHPPFSSCLQYFLASGSLLMSWLFASMTKVLELRFSIGPSNEYTGLISFRIDCLISLQSKRLSRVFSSTTTGKHQFCAQPSL